MKVVYGKKYKVQEAKREMLKPLMQKNDNQYLINPVWPVELEPKM